MEDGEKFLGKLNSIFQQQQALAGVSPDEQFVGQNIQAISYDVVSSTSFAAGAVVVTPSADNNELVSGYLRNADPNNDVTLNFSFAQGKMQKLVVQQGQAVKFKNLPLISIATDASSLTATLTGALVKVRFGNPKAFLDALGETDIYIILGSSQADKIASVLNNQLTIAVSHTYTLANYTGKGTLRRVTMLLPAGNQNADLSLKIMVDGIDYLQSWDNMAANSGFHTLGNLVNSLQVAVTGFVSVSDRVYLYQSGSALVVAVFYETVNFATSLLVQVKNGSGADTYVNSLLSAMYETYTSV